MMRMASHGRIREDVFIGIIYNNMVITIVCGEITCQTLTMLLWLVFSCFCSDILFSSALYNY